MADFNKSAILGYTDDMTNTLKNIALASLAAGVSMPLLSEMVRPEHPLILPTSGGAYSSIPVPESSMTEALPDYKRPAKKRSTKSVKELKNFNLAGAIKSSSTRLGNRSLLEGRSFINESSEKKSNFLDEFATKTLGNITENPYFLPGAVAAGVGPLIAGHMLSKSLIRKRDIDDKKDDTEDAKAEFAKALLQAQMGSPVRQVIKAGSGNRDIDELYENLEKLASSALGEQEKVAGFFGDLASGIKENYGYARDVTKELAKDFGRNAKDQWNTPGLLGRMAYVPVTALGEGLGFLGQGAGNVADIATGGQLGATAKALGDAKDQALKLTGDAWEGFKNYGGKGLTGVGGAMLAAGLLAGGAGTYYGHRAAKNEDTDTADSYKYLSEFLRRQQEEGTPISITPVPSAPKVKKPWYSIG